MIKKAIANIRKLKDIKNMKKKEGFRVVTNIISTQVVDISLQIIINLIKIQEDIQTITKLGMMSKNGGKMNKKEVFK